MKFLIGCLFVSIILLFVFQIPQNLYKHYTLVFFYNNLIEVQRNNDCKSQYELLLPSEKYQYTEDAFVIDCQKTKIYTMTPENVSFQINDDEGIITRTLTTCFTQACIQNDKVIDTGVRKYFFINGKWYFSKDNSYILCQREQPYSIPEEFNRSLSLIIQRLENSQYMPNTTFKEEDEYSLKRLKKIRNCLNIQYAQSISDMNGAEGVFYFDKESSNEELNILVSPNYKFKDDLLTAILLRHELTHAVYKATGDYRNISCLEQEAIAFATQVGFYMGALNQEERASIYNRYSTSNEAKNLIDMINITVNSNRPTYSAEIMEYLRYNEFYREQCKTN